MSDLVQSDVLLLTRLESLKIARPRLRKFNSRYIGTSKLPEISVACCKLSRLDCRFQVTFQRAVPKFVAKLPITFPSSKIGRELCHKVCKYISMFELL